MIITMLTIELSLRTELQFVVYTSVYSQNIVTAGTVGIYGIYNEINISIVVFMSLISVVLTIFCWVINHVVKLLLNRT